ncbi:MAG: DUF4389 domain-containing protein [Thermomicrobiales bacterium]|nr:DUF4389 domain-containing protein [Thermomicrobiales bacterium]
MNNQPSNCSSCGAPLRPGAQFCEECGTPVSAPAASLPATRPEWDVPVLTGFESAPPAMSYPGADPLLQFEVDYPERLSRWKIFVKWLLVIPHFVILYIFALAMSVVLFIAFFAILITGRFPRGLWDFSLLYTRWSTNVSVYGMLLLRDEYPPFGDAAYPARITLDYPEHLSRWKIFVKWLLVIPHIIVLMFLSIAMYVAVFIAFVAILITGKYPRGLFDFVVGTTRWSLRMSAYVSLMTDRYPPFSLD